MGETHVKVNLHWGGKVVYEAGSGLVRYSREPQVMQRFPISLKYDRLQRIFRSKMAVSDPKLTVVITGRYPNVILANGLPIFVECFPLVEQPTDTEFDLDVGDTTYRPSLNPGFPRGTLQQQAMVGVASQSKYTSGVGTRYDRVASMHYRNIDRSMHNREIGGKSKDLVRFQNLDRSVRHPENPGTSALVGGSSNQHHPAQLESIDRRNDIENNPTFTQPTKLVNNNNVANDEVNELDNNIFFNKLKMKDAVSLYSLHHRKESVSDQFRAKFWRVICKCNKQGCRWMIHFTEIPGGMWKAEKMIAEHSCTMDASEEVDHSNLRSNMIAIALIPSITINPYISIKDIQVNIKRLYKFMPSERKASRGRKRALEMVFGDFESSFKALPRYMAALQCFNPGTIVEWEHQSTTMQGYHIFKYLFWAFKPSVNGFKSCRPVISIDSTDLYGKYEMKLLIAMGIDANNNNLPLAYALVARENLMWLAATENQLKKFRQRMEQIKTLSHAAHLWLANLPLEKWTMHKDDGYRWGALTTNIHMSYNGLLMKARGLPVTAIGKHPWPLAIGKKFKEYTAKAQRHTDCMIYNTENAVFKIRTFADAGKGGNVHELTGGEKKCTCGKWRNYHMPCSHAIKSCHFRGIEPRDYISEYYSCRFYKLTYNGKFFPLGEEAYWPPSPFNLLANTKYERIEGVQHIAPSRMGRRCGNCKQTGHNRTRCPKNP
ncbi:hypothetical protein KY290_032830 [Solanum tuberosum]|uniref:SWIM-type domain-containing protein n=1 Tax=Solanum tuberosum TaxID=4113 RepID=A0ABQ7UD79_SOLTU|nr:hypothetical protein KY290_032830 [Solanum tuberosum]